MLSQDFSGSFCVDGIGLFLKGFSFFLARLLRITPKQGENSGYTATP